MKKEKGKGKLKKEKAEEKAEEKAVEEEVSTPGIDGPKWKLMNLAGLSESTKEVLKFKASKRTLKGAYEEVLAYLRGRNVELPYNCGRCNAPIDAEMGQCWACGSAFSDSTGEGEPEISFTELKERAKRLGIEVKGKDPATLVGEIEAAEARRRASSKARDADLVGIEAVQLNLKLVELMGDRWRPRVSNQYTTYSDPNGVRRIAVITKGLVVHFSVDDGFLDGINGLVFLTKEDRRKRHYGRTNYIYNGDISKDVLEICKKVLRHYR